MKGEIKPETDFQKSCCHNFDSINDGIIYCWKCGYEIREENDLEE